MSMYGRMNPEIKSLWVEALRSGRYRQGQSYLHSVEDDQYCCLGVLCEIALEQGIVTVTQDKTAKPAYGAPPNLPVIRYYGDEHDLNAEFLPYAVTNWAGLDSRNPYMDLVIEGDDGRVYTDEVPLSDLNDNRGWDFLAIADIIEREL